MADTSQYRLHAVKLDTDIWSSVVSDSARMDPQANHLFRQPAGRINIAAHALASVEPTIEFDVYKLDLVTSPTKGTLTLIFRSGTDTGGAGATYLSFQSEVCIYPVSMSAQAGGEATLSVRAYLLSSDGTTNPVTVGTTSASLTTGNDLYTVGASNIDGAAVAHIVDQTVNFNYDVQTDAGQSGQLYPTVPFITAHSPDVQMTTEDVSEATQTRVTDGEKVTTNAANLKFKHMNGGSDITVSMAGGVIQAQVNGGAPSTASLTVNGIDQDNDDSTFVVVS